MLLAFIKLDTEYHVIKIAFCDIHLLQLFLIEMILCLGTEPGIAMFS